MSQKKPPDQVRRRNTALVTNLPIDGREGDAPAWPLEDPPTPAEARRWDRVWSLPQAVIWEQWQLDEVVARYVRQALRAEAPDSGVRQMLEVRQLEDRLGLNPKSLFGLQWTLADPKPDLEIVPGLVEQRKRLGA